MNKLDPINLQVKIFNLHRHGRKAEFKHSHV